MNRVDLLLTREDLNAMESNPIFTLWAFGKDGILDDTELTESDIIAVKTRQMYYDVVLPDDRVFQALRHIKCDDYAEILNNTEYIKSCARLLGVRQDVFYTKIRLLQMRQEKELEDQARLNLTQ